MGSVDANISFLGCYARRDGTRGAATLLALLCAAGPLVSMACSASEPTESVGRSEQSADVAHCEINVICQLIGGIEICVPYIPVVHDCDDFANEFLQECQALGLDCYRLSYRCGSEGHAINVVCNDGLCCAVEPQGAIVGGPGHGLPPGGGGGAYPIPGGCWYQSGGTPNPPQSVIDALCAHIGEPGPGVIRACSDEIIVDTTDVPGNWCVSNNLTGTYTGCAACCQDTAARISCESLADTPWYDSCMQWCGDAYPNGAP